MKNFTGDAVDICSHHKKSNIINESQRALLQAGLIPDITAGILPEERISELEALHKQRMATQAAYRFSNNCISNCSFSVSAADGAVEVMRKERKRVYRDPNDLPKRSLLALYKGFGYECDWALYFALLGLLKKRGFFVQEDRHIKTNYHSLSRFHHQGGMGRLRFRSKIYSSGMCFQFYEDHTEKHFTGYEKWKNMSYLTKILLKAIFKGLTETALSFGLRDYTEPVLQNPFERLYWNKLNSWHWKQVPIHKPQNTESYNDKDADGVRLVNGDLRYYRHHDGRLRRGLVFHNINNMWWVISSDEMRNIVSWELFSPSAQGRHESTGRAISEKTANNIIKRELEAAIKGEDFKKAAILRDIRNRRSQD